MRYNREVSDHFLAQRVNLNITTVNADDSFIKEDAYGMVSVDSAAEVTLTVEPDATTEFEVGTSISVEQAGEGQVIVAPATGVTINSSESLRTRTQYSVLVLIKKSPNTWLLTGDAELA